MTNTDTNSRDAVVAHLRRRFADAINDTLASLEPWPPGLLAGLLGEAWDAGRAYEAGRAWIPGAPAPVDRAESAPPPFDPEPRSVAELERALEHGA